MFPSMAVGALLRRFANFLLASSSAASRSVMGSRDQRSTSISRYMKPLSTRLLIGFSCLVLCVRVCGRVE
eukprot:1088817-Amphidinium_carterae.1